jgi:hypothetical protein
MRRDSGGTARCLSRRAPVRPVIERCRRAPLARRSSPGPLPGAAPRARGCGACRPSQASAAAPHAADAPGDADTRRASASANVVVQHGWRSRLGSRSGWPSPCALRHLTARVPEMRRHPIASAAAGTSRRGGSVQGIHARRRRMTAWKSTRRSLQPQNPCKSNTSRVQRRRAGRQVLSDNSTTKALQIARIMELAGLEPAASWVRSRRSPN